MYRPVLQQNKQDLYSSLMANNSGHENARILAGIMSSWQDGRCALPRYLGLDSKDYYELLEHFFPNINVESFVQPNADLDLERSIELDEVEQLIFDHRAGLSVAEKWFAKILAIACQGQDHLWQDLGVHSRKDLSLLLSLNFPTLAEKNVKDMKWKKFIYKQLCIAEGIYVCRAPSCEVCVDYDNCFGPEE